MLRFTFHRLLISACALFAVAQFVCADITFENEVRPLLQNYCIECHSGPEPKGQMNFSAVETKRDAASLDEKWEAAVSLIESRDMPPDGAPQPSDAERRVIINWYEQFVKSVKARPGRFRPRRLSAVEFRNTLRGLFGFDLEVNVIEAEQTDSEKSLVLKLMPTDPPGASGFTNDTHTNPLTTVTWDRQAYLVETALEELFLPEHRRHLARLVGPIDSDFTGQHAKRLLRAMLPKIRRRPVAETEFVEATKRIQSASDPIAAVCFEIKAELMSPAFLYRGLLMEGKPGQQPVDQFELAERISYFLWADMPDEELLASAAAGRLGDAEIKRQVNRMLDSPRSRSLAEDFGVQWLTLNGINDSVSNNPPFRNALRSQPVDFVDYLIREDRPLLELVDSNVTFVNPLTRKYYKADRSQFVDYEKPKGVEVEAVPNHKLILEKTPGRGGLLLMPGVLAMNRGPILRGVWTLERILGEELPEPPPDVGEVKPNRGDQNLTFRERFEQHRSNSTCAVCHDKIDPIGFAMQAWDEKGGFRRASDYGSQTKRKRNSPKQDEVVDTSGRLPSGETFDDFDGLKKILLTSRREAIVRNLVKRMMSYALCRKLKLHDRPTVDDIVRRLVEQGTWRELIHEVADSLPFRETILE